MQKYWWYDSEWHSKMDKSLQVAGMGERTREAYLRSMRQLVEYYDKYPDLIVEEELLDYFIHRLKRRRLESRYHAHLLFRHQVLLHPYLKERLASIDHCQSTQTAAFTGSPLQR